MNCPSAERCLRSSLEETSRRMGSRCMEEKVGSLALSVDDFNRQVGLSSIPVGRMSRRRYPPDVYFIRRKTLRFFSLRK